MGKSIFEITPVGAKAGIDEHTQKIDTLNQEKNLILKKESLSEEDNKRLDNIQTEINIRNKEIEKLRPFLKSSK
ncbi:hypothetical protein [Serratia proteamaculans]